MAINRQDKMGSEPLQATDFISHERREEDGNWTGGIHLTMFCPVVPLSQAE